MLSCLHSWAVPVSLFPLSCCYFFLLLLSNISSLNKYWSRAHSARLCAQLCESDEEQDWPGSCPHAAYSLVQVLVLGELLEALPLFAGHIEDESLLAVKHCSWSFTYMYSFNSHQKMKMFILWLKRPSVGESGLPHSRSHSRFQVELGPTHPAEAVISLCP